MTDKADDRGSAVPKGRLSRLGRFGRLAAGTAGEALGNTVQAEKLIIGFPASRRPI